jgi:hypothetical protein
MGQVECGPFTWFSQEGHELPPPGEWPPYRTGRLPAPERFDELTAVEGRLAGLCEQPRTSPDHVAVGAGPHTLERVTYLLATLRWLLTYDRAALQLWQDGPIEAALRHGEAALARGDSAAAEASGREALDLLASCGLGAAIQILAKNVTNQGELGVLAAVNGKAVAAYKCLIARAEALARTRRAAALLAGGNWPATLHVWV